MLRTLFVLYGAGTLGATICTAVAVLATDGGLLQAVGTTFRMHASGDVVYRRLVWGGVWALALKLPGVSKLGWIQGGFLVSLVPTAAQLLYFFPRAGSGWFGLELGWGTPIAVAVLNLVWGVLTALAASRAK